MEVTDSVWVIVRALHRSAQIQRKAAAHAPFGPAATGLLNLAAQQPVRPSDAAAELGLPAQSITRAAAELGAAGLIERVGDGADGRSYRIELTDAGRAAVEQFRVEVAAAFRRHLDGWDDAEVVTFAEKLRQLVDSLATDVEDAVQAPRRQNPWRGAPQPARREGTDQK